jgi:hypothetical protein
MDLSVWSSRPFNLPDQLPEAKLWILYARSGRLRPLIPIDCDQAFRLIATTRSGASRPACGQV